ncbi:hypothetical protein G5D69_004395 [Salmonella enterica]|nr:hypothetical protein [Salmonella enterica]
MNKTVITAALLCSFVAGTAQADESADPNDPCAMILCLAGKLEGESPHECDPMYKSFISIYQKKSGKFSASRTSDKRKSKLNECPAGDNGTIDKIISKYGRLKSW